MIFNSDVIQLVLQIEQGNAISKNFYLLTQAISTSFQNFQPQRNLIQNKPKQLRHYPIENGYALSFDPLTQSQELVEHWYRYGFVVGKDVVSTNISFNAVEKILDIAQKFTLNDETTYLKDSKGNPILSRGFFELYHDNCLAQIRQSLRLYLHHCLIWNSPYLWTSFDRLGVKTPRGENAIGLNLHVDQNPTVHSDFTTVQGVLALEDCPIERGTFVVVPSSADRFKEYSQFVTPGYKGEFIALEESSLSKDFENFKQYIPLKKNNIVSWDSRTTHANSSNISDINRYVCYVSAGLAQEDRLDLIQERVKAFHSGLGTNVRDAYLHASKKPRFTHPQYIHSIRQKENLSPLGKCLYGFQSYEQLKNNTF